jgi:hypothetical protein
MSCFGVPQSQVHLAAVERLDDDMVGDLAGAVVADDPAGAARAGPGLRGGFPLCRALRR